MEALRSCRDSLSFSVERRRLHVAVTLPQRGTKPLHSSQGPQSIDWRYCEIVIIYVSGQLRKDSLWPVVVSFPTNRHTFRLIIQATTSAHFMAVPMLCLQCHSFIINRKSSEPPIEQLAASQTNPQCKVWFVKILKPLYVGWRKVVKLQLDSCWWR